MDAKKHRWVRNFEDKEKSSIKKRVDFALERVVMPVSLDRCLILCRLYCSEPFNSYGGVTCDPLNSLDISYEGVVTLWPDEKIRTHKLKNDFVRQQRPAGSSCDQKFLVQGPCDLWPMKIIRTYEACVTCDRTNWTVHYSTPHWRISCCWSTRLHYRRRNLLLSMEGLKLAYEI